MNFKNGCCQVKKFCYLNICKDHHINTDEGSVGDDGITLQNVPNCDEFKRILLLLKPS